MSRLAYLIGSLCNNWEFPSWSNFSYNVQGLHSLILKFAQETGEISGMLHGLPKELKDETLMQLMLTEAIKTSAIEGESKATATRDLLALQSLGVLAQEGAGRSVKYQCNLNQQP